MDGVGIDFSKSRHFGPRRRRDGFIFLVLKNCIFNLKHLKIVIIIYYRIDYAIFKEIDPYL